MNDEESAVSEEQQEFLEAVPQDCIEDNNTALQTEAVQNEELSVFIKGEPSEHVTNEEDYEELERDSEDQREEVDIKPGICVNN